MMSKMATVYTKLHLFRHHHPYNDIGNKMHKQDICVINVLITWYTPYELVNKQIHISILKPCQLLFSYVTSEQMQKVAWCIGVVLATHIDRLHTPHLSLAGLFCCCKWKPNVHKPPYMGYCFCNNCTFLHIHCCIRTPSDTALLQEPVDSNIKQERSDLNLRQMSNQMQQVPGGVGDFHQLSPNHGHAMRATNMQARRTRSWCRALAFGRTTWV